MNSHSLSTNNRLCPFKWLKSILRRIDLGTGNIYVEQQFNKRWEWNQSIHILRLILALFWTNSVTFDLFLFFSCFWYWTLKLKFKCTTHSEVRSLKMHEKYRNDANQCIDLISGLDFRSENIFQIAWQFFKCFAHSIQISNLYGRLTWSFYKFSQIMVLFYLNAFCFLHFCMNLSNISCVIYSKKIFRNNVDWKEMA